jgi:hypothetical protein
MDSDSRSIVRWGRAMIEKLAELDGTNSECWERVNIASADGSGPILIELTPGHWVDRDRLRAHFLDLDDASFQNTLDSLKNARLVVNPKHVDPAASWRVRADGSGWLEQELHANAKFLRLSQSGQLVAKGLAEPPDLGPDDIPPSWFSLDFTSATWNRLHFTFTKGNQAESVKTLYEAWKAGQHSLSQETIGTKVSPQVERFELRKVFRRRNSIGRYEQHPAWGTMIVKDSKGCYRLVPPEHT